MLVQIENNWINKIPQTAKIGRLASSNFGRPQNFFHPIISKLDIACTCVYSLEVNNLALPFYWHLGWRKGTVRVKYMYIQYRYIIILYAYTVNSRLADTPLLQTPAITDKTQPSPRQKLHCMEVWLKMTSAIADSLYYGLQTTSRGCPL